MSSWHSISHVWTNSASQWPMSKSSSAPYRSKQWPMVRTYQHYLPYTSAVCCVHRDQNLGAKATFESSLYETLNYSNFVLKRQCWLRILRSPQNCHGRYWLDHQQLFHKSERSAWKAAARGFDGPGAEAVCGEGEGAKERGREEASWRGSQRTGREVVSKAYDGISKLCMNHWVECGIVICSKSTGHYDDGISWLSVAISLNGCIHWKLADRLR